MNEQKISEQATRLFDEIDEYYKFLVESITPEDWPIMQEELGYIETYEEHRESLIENVPEPSETRQQIQAFLNRYQEFSNPKYIELMKMVNKRLSASRDHVKANAFEILKRNNEGLQKKTEAMSSDTFSVRIQNKQMDFPTFHNPLIVSLYSILITWFSMELCGQPPELIPPPITDVDPSV